MKNITRTIRILNVEYPIKAGNVVETRNANIIDMGAAAVRAELKRVCDADGVKFLGEFEVVSAEENIYAMPLDTFVEFATKMPNT